MNGALHKGGYAGHEVRVLQKENDLIVVNCFSVDFNLQPLEYALWRVSLGKTVAGDKNKSYFLTTLN